MLVFRSFFREILINTLLIVGGLFALTALLRTVKYLFEAATGNLAAQFIVQVMFYRLPEFMQILMPIGLGVGVLIALLRMRSDNELLILITHRVRLWQLILFVVAPASVVAFVVGLCSLYLTPLGRAMTDDLLARAHAQAMYEVLLPDQFHSHNGLVVHVSELTDESPHNIFIADTRATPFPAIITAENGSMTQAENSDYYLKLQNGSMYFYNENKSAADFNIVHFKHYRQWFASPLHAVNNERKIEAIKTSALMASDDLHHRAMYQWRLISPLSAIIAPLIVLGCISPRPPQRRGGDAAFATMSLLVYFLFLVTIFNQIESTPPSEFAMWSVQWGWVLFAFVAMAQRYHLMDGWLRQVRKRISAYATS